MLKVFHIIEETADQQVIEITAKSLSDAIMQYMRVCTHESWDSIDVQQVGRICYNYPSEYCTITAYRPQVVFAKWTHKKSLY